MKKLYTLFLVASIAMLCSPSVMGQNSSRLAFEKGDFSINAGISFGLIGYGYGYNSTGFAVPLQVTVDYGIHEYISVGGYAGYMGRSYGNSTYKHRYSAISFGAHGTFHASTFLNDQFDFNIDDEKLDLYGRVLLGVEIHSWKYDSDYLNDYLYDTSGSRMIFGPVLGARYMFNPNIGVYSEAGRGAYGWLTVGVSFKI